MFLRTFAEESCCLGIGRSRSHHRIQGAELTQMLQFVDTSAHLLLQFLPVPKAHRLFIMQQLYHHVALGILIEDHLQIGCHRQELVHRHILWGNLHQVHQSEEIRVVSKAQVCPYTTTSNGSIGICLNPLPQGDGTTGWDAFILNHVTMNSGHALIVLSIDSLHLFLCKEVIE